MERFNKGEIDADTSCQIEKQILTDEIDDPEFLNFAVENISELFGYPCYWKSKHQDTQGYNRPPIAFLRKLGMGASKMWFGVG